MKKIFTLKIICFGLCICLLPACLKQKEDNGGGTVMPPVQPHTYDWPKIADTAQNALNNYFYNAAGRYFTPQPQTTAYNYAYWPNAHALDVLIDAYLRKSKDAAIKTQMDNLVDGLKAANGNTFSNYYYDDMEWLLISTLRAFKESGDAKYKAIADGIWSEVKGGWDNVSGGGFYWRKDRVNKNTPANAPACIFAARLYQISGDAADLTWAKNTYAWLKTQLIKSNGDVWDGLYTNINPITYDNRAFTYNYGTVIGSALELYKITNDPAYAADAVSVASQCIASMARNGLLPAGDPGDGGLFNGIFVRYLTRLIVEGNLSSSTKDAYIAFLKKNAESMWSKGTLNPPGLIGPDWKITPSSTTLTPMLSGVMLAEAMAELKRLNLL